MHGGYELWWRKGSRCHPVSWVTVCDSKGGAAEEHFAPLVQVLSSWLKRSWCRGCLSDTGLCSCRRSAITHSTDVNQGFSWEGFIRASWLSLCLWSFRVYFRSEMCLFVSWSSLAVRLGFYMEVRGAGRETWEKNGRNGISRFIFFLHKPVIWDP